ncbi:MAG: hypothetical protein NT069_18850 [Planctomycetota bacterium]|nr:hypothetical protein [Planctomycetota bacterium]
MARRPITWTYVFLGGVVILTLAAVRADAVGSHSATSSAKSGGSEKRAGAHRLLVLRNSRPKPKPTPAPKVEVVAPPADESADDAIPVIEIDVAPAKLLAPAKSEPIAESDTQVTDSPMSVDTDELPEIPDLGEAPQFASSPDSDDDDSDRCLSAIVEDDDEAQSETILTQGTQPDEATVPPAPAPVGASRIKYRGSDSRSSLPFDKNETIDRAIGGRNGIQINSVRKGSASIPENRAAPFMDLVPLYQVSNNWTLRQPNRYTHDIYFRSLYFEQPQLERCGRGLGCWTTVASAGTFVTHTILLPYSAIVRCPSTLVTPLGDCTTWSTYPCGVTIPRPFEDRGDQVEFEE